MGLIYVTWGSKLFGRVDRVPGFFYVATEFAHVWYFPLAPIRSVLVTGENEAGWQGWQIPLNFKSVLLGWSLPVLLLVWTLGGTIAVVLCTDHHVDPGDQFLSASIAIGAFVLWLALLIVP